MGTSKIIYYTLFQGLYWFSSVNMDLAFFFLPWGSPILGGRLTSSASESLASFGILSILMAFAVQESQSLCFGLICCLSLWINLFILFAILPILGN